LNLASPFGAARDDKYCFVSARYAGPTAAETGQPVEEDRRLHVDGAAVADWADWLSGWIAREVAVSGISGGKAIVLCLVVVAAPTGTHFVTLRSTSVASSTGIVASGTGPEATWSGASRVY